MRVVIMKYLVIVLFSHSLSITYAQSQNRLSAYWKLALYWPNAYCNIDKRVCKDPVPQNFKIHGLSSCHANGSIIYHGNFTDRSTLRRSEIHRWNFIDRLYFHWPNLSRGEARDVWRWEWRHHGSNNMTAENFFDFALRNAEIYIAHLNSMISSGKVTPRNEPYKVGEMYKVITKALVRSPRLRCNKKSSDGVAQLLAIQICMDMEEVPFDCQKTLSDCGTTVDDLVFFPTKETVMNTTTTPREAHRKRRATHHERRNDNIPPAGATN